LQEEIERKKKILGEIYKKALNRAAPCRLVQEALSFKEDILYILDKPHSFERLFVIGFGKASCTMARGVEEVIPAEKFEGMVVTKYGHGEKLSKLKVLEAAHPIPDENSISATKEIIHLLQKAKTDDLVLFLISGGGSALLESPEKNINLSDMQQVTDLLLRCGANISEINTIRKHLSRVKGGGLARITSPAKFISLIISDVIGSDLSSIASGPCVGDPTTFSDCIKIIEKYDLSEKIPPNALKLIKDGNRGIVEDNPKPGDPFFEGSENIILADNKKICEFIIEETEKMGLNTHFIDSPLTTGPAELLIEGLKDIIVKYEQQGKNRRSSPALILMGGEVTVIIPDGKTGLGGRNQHLSLLFTKEIIPSFKNSVALFASTDGTDGPTDASGGFSHSGIVEKIKNKPGELRKAIDSFDSYHFLKKYGELLNTGPTGNNLNDVFLIYL